MENKIFMITDDDEDDRFFFKEALTNMRCSLVCLEARDGAEALELLQKAEQLPDYIFLDMNMPRMDGRECLKELKKEAKFNTIKVIMYSTTFSEQSITDFYQLGAATYLKKPTDINKLPEQIREAVNSCMNVS